MDLKKKKTKLYELYEQYERLVQPYKSRAVCEKGCASCCIDVGSVGATTMEGLIILEHLQGWNGQAVEEMNRSLEANRSEKLRSALVRCPFLDKEQSCRIYAVRPFSCRRLYSVRKCEGQGAVVHRQAVMVGQKIEKELQQLDADGCSGHLSFILHVLEKNGLQEDYQREKWSKAEFKDLIERYELVVHK